MIHYFNSLKLLYHMLRNGKPPVNVKSCNTEGATFQALDIYSLPSKKEKGTILFLHGMNKLGGRDDRIINISHAFASCGYRILVPTFDSICQFKLDIEKQRTDFKQALTWLFEHPEICPNKKISILTASFSSTIVMSAVDAHIEHLLLVGAFYDTKQIVKAVMYDKSMDQYARLILTANMMRHDEKTEPAVFSCMQHAINDELSDTQSNEFIEALSKLKPEQQQLISAIVNKSYDPDELLTRFAKSINQYIYPFVYNQFLKEAACSFFLMHSACDKVFEPSQSIQLHQSLLENNKNSQLVVTDMLDHADVQLSLKTLTDSFKIVKLFANFINIKSESSEHA